MSARLKSYQEPPSDDRRFPVRLTTEDLRVRFGRNGKLMSVRSVRRLTKLIGRIKSGRNWLFPLECVEQYERSRTRIAA